MGTARWGALAFAAGAVVALAGCGQSVSGTATPVGGGAVTAPPTSVTVPPPTTTTRTTVPPTTTVSGPVDTSPLDLEVGDCIAQSLEGDSVSTVPVVPCSQEHNQEVYAIELIADGAFPGSDAVSEQARQVCRAEFEVFVGLAYDDSDLYLNTLYPTEGSWGGGDREIVCLIYDKVGPVTGSLRGANR